ncbi:putative lipid-binding protein At4g00165 [Apium graveolens]|uniref:putative lipid-binding protein At4g00165 n=1 Tax=Apium graveolens TaxID=4045 RepID=UPI003D7B4D45
MVSMKGMYIFILFNSILFTSTVTCLKLTCPPTGSSGNPNVPKTQAKCPKDTLKFGVCGDWLGLVHETIGAKPSAECCALLKGLADVEAAVCLCTVIKANVVGVVKLKVPVALSLLVNSCGKKVPDGFVCA